METWIAGTPCHHASITQAAKKAYTEARYNYGCVVIVNQYLLTSIERYSEPRLISLHAWYSRTSFKCLGVVRCLKFGLQLYPNSFIHQRLTHPITD